MRDLVSLRGDAVLDDPVFRSRRGRHLDPSAVFRIVRRAAERAELEAGSNVSPHWLRHAHATHALERGAPIHLVQATLGHASVATTGRGRYLHARPTDSSARYTSG
jgi:integrase/recombinase XerD